jgi:L,D-peptidoglycan transpeptidase YkuD (ErfK/YbiS/YcfS/YnhG family)
VKQVRAVLPNRNVNSRKRLQLRANLRVTSAPGWRMRGLLTFRGASIPVALGRSGIKANKREGDGSTPRGHFALVRLWWRADRMPRPKTRLPVRRIEADDGWCEDPLDRRYNRTVKLSPASITDRLWRDDHLYDLVVELDHNTRPRVKNLGSAVFIHVAREGFAPTAGCVALRMFDLHRLLGWLDRGDRIEIG